MFHPGLNNKQICNLRTINYYKTKKPQDFRIEAFDLKVIPIGLINVDFIYIQFD
jgi:hypothetical protein